MSKPGWGPSLDAQKSLCEQYCRGREWPVVATNLDIFSAYQYGGRKRKAYNRMMGEDWEK